MSSRPASAQATPMDNILSVARASKQAGQAAAALLEASNGLSSQSEKLKFEVDSFLASVRVG